MDIYDANNLQQNHKRRSANEGYHYMVANDAGRKVQVHIPLQAQYFPNQQYFLPQQQFVRYHPSLIPPKITKIPVIAGGRKKTFSKRSKTGCLTCRSRRIKCDEGHSTCKQCLKSKRICMYPDNSKSKKDDEEDDEIAREKNRKKNYKEINRSVEMFTVEIPNLTRQSTANSQQYPCSKSHPTASTAAPTITSNYNACEPLPQFVNGNEPRYGEDEHILPAEVIGQSPQQLPYLVYQSPTSENSCAAAAHYRTDNINITELPPCQHSCCNKNYSGYRLTPTDNYYTPHASSAPIAQNQLHFSQHPHQAYFMKHSQSHYPCH
jgi:hypothetical protein